MKWFHLCRYGFRFETFTHFTLSCCLAIGTWLNLICRSKYSASFHRREHNFTDGGLYSKHTRTECFQRWSDFFLAFFSIVLDGYKDADVDRDWFEYRDKISDVEFGGRLVEVSRFRHQTALNYNAGSARAFLNFGKSIKLRSARWFCIIQMVY